ncbi:hypothetical protein [Cupriavidus pauculus]|uniref:hypothetical protein n=1 Tax=Cupriavidus pauculus TaxID=82633 RepID=UPI001CC2F031|nr:hypothetical protein [Cupriavidus pauculus]
MAVVTRNTQGSARFAVVALQLPSVPVVTVACPLTHLIVSAALVIGAPVAAVPEIVAAGRAVGVLALVPVLSSPPQLARSTAVAIERAAAHCRCFIFPIPVKD